MHAFIHSPIIRDIFICISLLTRLPVQLDERAYEHRSAAGWAFPLVGVLLGYLPDLSIAFVDKDQFLNRR